MKVVSSINLKYQLRMLFTLFLVLLTPISSTVASEPPTEDWYYTLRPGDNLLKISQSLLNRQHSWTELLRHNNIEQVANLAPGSIIRIPMHWLKHQPQPAKVLSISGRAQIKRANDTRFKILKDFMQVRVGDEVSTLQGNVVIEFADGSTIRLEEQSNLIFNKLSHFGKTGMVDTRLRLKRGALSTEVTPLVKGSRYEITTPSAVAAVRGTNFRVVSSDNQTKIEVIEGSVDFSGKHGATIVKAGEGAVIKQNSSTIERSILPAPPKPQFASKTVTDLPSKLTWEQQKNIEQYKLQITDKQNNDKLIRTNKSTKPEALLENIQNGEYDIAMRSIDKNGFEGIDSVTKVSVDISSEIAQLISPKNESVIETPKPEFLWQLKDESILSKLEIAKDVNFSSVIGAHSFNKKAAFKMDTPLAPGTYFWRVQTMAEDSKQTASAIHSFSLRGVLSPVKILSVNYVESQVGLFWNKIKNADAYTLQIATTNDFEKVIKEQTLVKTRAHLKLKVGKKYYARVKAMGSELFTSEFGPAKTLFIPQAK